MNVDTSSISIQSLINFDSDEWQMNNLHHFFPPEEVALITQVRPNMINTWVGYSWDLNINGLYTVKSGYWNWKHRIRNKSEAKLYNQPSMDRLYQLVWSSKTLPKIQNFLWRALSNSLAVGSNMFMKKLTLDGSCIRCGMKEDVNHVLFSCPYARLVWALSPLSFLFYPYPSESFHVNLASCLIRLDTRSSEYLDRFKAFPWIIWRLWKARNDLSFDAGNIEADIVVAKAINDAEEWFLHHTSSPDQGPGSVHCPRSIKWVPPIPGKLKCNTDATWSKLENNIGLGWILRDHQGHLKWCGFKCFPKTISPLHAEATAMLWAMRCVDNLGFTEVIFESDSANLIKALSDPVDWPIIYDLTSEIHGTPRSSLVPSFGLVYREANVCADSVAHHASSLDLYCGSLDCSIPNWLRPKLMTDLPVSGS